MYLSLFTFSPFTNSFWQTRQSTVRERKHNDKIGSNHRVRIRRMKGMGIWLCGAFLWPVFLFKVKSKQAEKETDDDWNDFPRILMATSEAFRRIVQDDDGMIISGNE